MTRKNSAKGKKDKRMKDKLRITTIQADIVWESINSNLLRFDALLNNISKPTDLIILPEMFTTGFTMNQKDFAEDEKGEALNWMRNQAKSKKAAIVGSIIFNWEDDYYNRLYFVFPDGSFKTYNKRHLFRMGEENLHYKQGIERLIVEYEGWRICPLICYDLRFPVWSRNNDDYDLLIYIANWPMSRREVWKTLLAARAIENQSFVAGVNRVGKDGMDINYSGDTQIIDAKGQIVSQSSMDEESVISVEISLSELNAFREKFPVLKDADKFTIEN